VGTLIVKPSRHVTSVAALDQPEAGALGPLLRDAAGAVRDLGEADQVYVCLWSHAGWEAGHIHFVVQPAWNGDRGRFPGPGPATQMALFQAGASPDRQAVEEFSERARAWFGESRP
jgi:diadenosine tetraphosphate (Ap4A) HIT family hydrolase